MLQGEEGEVDELDERPDHPVGLERRPPRLLEALLGAGALHGGHAAEEDANHDGREERLVAADAGERLEARVAQVDAAGQDAEPRRGDGSKDACNNSAFMPSAAMSVGGRRRRKANRKGRLTAAVEGHAAGAGQVMLLQALLLNELLRRDVARGEEHRRGDALGEQRARRQLGVVPEMRNSQRAGIDEF